MKRKILEFILRFFTKQIIRKYKPVIVGVTGSVGKTSTKEAIAAVLSSRFYIRKTKKNLNTDIGLHLVFIGGEEAKSSALKWLKNLFKAVSLVLLREKRYPEYIVAEMGADRPGDIRKLVEIARPQISVVTAIGNIPAHAGYYKDAEAVAREKSEIVRCLGKDDTAILNCDDPMVIGMKNATEASCLTFGFDDSADIRVSDFKMYIETKEENGRKINSGITFCLHYKGSFVSVQLSDFLGKSYAYAMAAGAAVGVACGLNLKEIAAGLAQFMPESGRMRVIPGIYGSIIFDDTYNAAPRAMENALEILRAVLGSRKIAVLGDMLELGDYSKQAHQAVGKTASEFCDYIIFVGKEMKQAYKTAIQAGFEARKVFHCERSVMAVDLLQPIIKKGDIILVKGSQAMRMELVVERIMEEPEKAKGLLVRQEDEWKNNK